MVRWALDCCCILGVVLGVMLPTWGQTAGGIRGVIYDKEFDVPVSEAQVMIADTGKKTQSTDQGHYILRDVAPGSYTLVFTKEGYYRQVKANIMVYPGQLTDLDVQLLGEFTEMDELVVQDIQIGTGTELALLTLRSQAPALMDSISADLMRQAGAGDAASALRLVAGATVQEGKYAVIRGLPDRYVSSQMNGVRLPSADPDKRAVQLDQFPSAVIESVQVSKTFTPDQQGDASGGAVNVILKGIPNENILQFNAQVGYNTQATGNSKFLSYRNGGVNYWGIDDGARELPPQSALGIIRDPSVVGVSRGDAPPPDYKWSFTAGGKYDLPDKWKVGGLASFFYESGYTFHDNGVDDSWWIDLARPPAQRTISPATSKGRPNFDSPETGSFYTKLFDITQGAQTVKWGSLGTIGLENDKNSLAFIYLFTQAAEDKATLAEDTRGKAYFFPGYNVNDPAHPGNENLFSAPYQRVETLLYTERTTETFQLKGRHELPWADMGEKGLWLWQAPVVDWTLASSFSRLYQPDKRMFGSEWYAFGDGLYLQNKPANNFTLGQFQEIWKDVKEDSLQQIVNIKLPFTQWSDSKGYFKTGIFHDKVERTYRQNSYSNLADFNTSYWAPFNQYWSEVWPSQPHSPIKDGKIDVNYDGRQDILAWYVMVDLPVTSYLNILGGLRHEHTDLSTHLMPEENAGRLQPLNDVNFRQDDLLPAIGLVYQPDKAWTLRLNYAETVARQTFKELTPIEHQEYLGADIFIGNPDLKMSDLKNYDIRLDYVPYEGGLVSVSYFYKDIKKPIEYVQEVADLGFPYYYTTARNYASGVLSGIEIEIRQDLGKYREELKGLTIGGNATLISSKVDLPDKIVRDFTKIGYPMSSRDMTNAPEYLYNIYVAYDIADTGTQMGLFYSVRGDTLVAGAAAAVNSAGFATGFVPSIYEKEYGTLNFNLTQSVGKYVKLTFQAKNLTDPLIQKVYRSEYIGGDIVKSSYTKGIDFSFSVSVKIDF